MRSEHLLWYTRPAKAWTDALPLGNGRIGAMVFSGIDEDRWALNEDTLWSGYPRVCKVPGAPEALEEARRLMRQDRYQEAVKVLESGFTGAYTQAYMPLGDLVFRFEHTGEVSDYRRELDIERGLSRCEYTRGGIRYTREGFTSLDPAHSLLAIRLSADKPASLSFSVALTSPLKSAISGHEAALEVRGECPGYAAPSYLNLPDPLRYSEEPAERGIQFLARVEMRVDGGSVSEQNGVLHIEGADSAVVYLGVRTSYNGFDKHPCLEGADHEAALRADFEALADCAYEELRSAHIKAFSALMDRTELCLGGAPRADIPTEARLRGFDPEKGDEALYELAFNYGRYLLCASSQPGTQAANLQGIWNESVVPPWSSNYTININTEMNYYPAEATALGELHGPMFDLIDKLCVNGQQTARDFYNARGAVSHHNADIWGQTNPVGDRREGSVVWAFWPMSLGWMCRHLFDHYLYTLDRAFLEKRALPAMREAARFYLDVLQRDPEGRLTIFPATSPENCFVCEGQPCPLAKSSTMSNSIVRELLGNYLRALEILGREEDMADEARAALRDLYPMEIGSQGQILEWDKEYEEAEPHHRHTSHLYGLHPAREIDPERTPELAAAARRTLELRGDDGTGWSLGWKINFWARLNDGDHALKLLKKQLRFVDTEATVYTGGGGTYLNLFDAHPPFQIDGNFAATSGIAEMLLRSDPDRLTLLPALPTEWPSGSVTGLRGMGGTEISLSWSEGRLREARIISREKDAPPMAVYWGARRIGTIDKPGETVFTMD